MSPKLLNPAGERVIASAKAAPILIADHGYQELSLEVAEDAGEPGDPKVEGEKAIDAMTSTQLDAFALELKIEDWNPKAKVADKKQAIKDHIAALPADDDEPEADDLDDLTDEQLDEKAEELSLEVAEDADRETLIAAIREALAATE